MFPLRVHGLSRYCLPLRKTRVRWLFHALLLRLLLSYRISRDRSLVSTTCHIAYTPLGVQVITPQLRLGSVTNTISLPPFYLLPTDLSVVLPWEAGFEHLVGTLGACCIPVYARFGCCFSARLTQLSVALQSAFTRYFQLPQSESL